MLRSRDVSHGIPRNGSEDASRTPSLKCSEGAERPPSDNWEFLQIALSPQPVMWSWLCVLSQASCDSCRQADLARYQLCSPALGFCTQTARAKRLRPLFRDFDRRGLVRPHRTCSVLRYGGTKGFHGRDRTATPRASYRSGRAAWSELLRDAALITFVHNDAARHGVVSA